MEKLRILLVEDSPSDVDSCNSTIKRYRAEKKADIECVTARTKEEAMKRLDASFDGAIVDIKLDGEGTEGNDVIEAIHSAQRIPVAVLTGTPENITVKYEFLGSFKKGETGYDEILDLIIEVHATGITKILGGRGDLEAAMDRIFWDHFLPQFNNWRAYRNSGKETERAILRMVLNHLLDLLGNDENPAYPEEMYIIPPLSSEIKTGSIIKMKEGKMFIVISPPCDLVIRKTGTFKTDRILLAELAPFREVCSPMLEGVKSAKRISKIAELLKNNHSEYYHWLPEVNGFNGGFINFRWTMCISKDELIRDFEKPLAQLSAPFVKEVIARFSAFYARQGQPDFDFDNLATKLAPPR